MATKDSREVVIEASPEQILDVIADVEAPALAATAAELTDPVIRMACGAGLACH